MQIYDAGTRTGAKALHAQSTALDCQSIVLLVEGGKRHGHEYGNPASGSGPAGKTLRARKKESKPGPFNFRALSLRGRKQGAKHKKVISTQNGHKKT